jgi:hypothetical protein
MIAWTLSFRRVFIRVLPLPLLLSCFSASSHASIISFAQPMPISDRLDILENTIHGTTFDSFRLFYCLAGLEEMAFGETMSGSIASRLDRLEQEFGLSPGTSNPSTPTKNAPAGKPPLPMLTQVPTPVPTPVSTQVPTPVYTPVPTLTQVQTQAPAMALPACLEDCTGIDYIFKTGATDEYRCEVSAGWLSDLQSGAGCMADCNTVVQDTVMDVRMAAKCTEVQPPTQIPTVAPTTAPSMVLPACLLDCPGIDEMFRADTSDESRCALSLSWLQEGCLADCGAVIFGTVNDIRAATKCQAPPTPSPVAVPTTAPTAKLPACLLDCKDVPVMFESDTSDERRCSLSWEWMQSGCMDDCDSNILGTVAQIRQATKCKDESTPPSTDPCSAPRHRPSFCPCDTSVAGQCAGVCVGSMLISDQDRAVSLANGLCLANNGLSAGDSSSAGTNRALREEIIPFASLSAPIGSVGVGAAALHYMLGDDDDAHLDVRDLDKNIGSGRTVVLLVACLVSTVAAAVTRTNKRRPLVLETDRAEEPHSKLGVCMVV